MSHPPIDPRRLLDGVPQLGDIFDGYGLVHEACRWIIAVCARSAYEIDRARAGTALASNPSLVDRLDGRMIVAVLRRFPASAPASPAPSRPARVGTWLRDHRIGYVKRAHDAGYAAGYVDGLAAHPNSPAGTR